MRGWPGGCVSRGVRDVVMGIIAVRPRRLVWKGTFGVRVLAREPVLVVCSGMEKGDRVLRICGGGVCNQIAFT